MESGQLGVSQGLGPCLDVVRAGRDRAWRRLVRWAGGAMCAVALLAALGLTSGHAYLEAVVTLVAGFGVWWALDTAGRPRASGRRMYLYQDGLIQVIPGEPAARVIRWNDVAEITLTFHGDRVSGLTVRDGAGTEITAAAGGSYPWTRLGGIAAQAEWALAPRFVPPLLQAYDSGAPIRVGTCTINLAGITAPGGFPVQALRFTSWSEIESIRLTRAQDGKVTEPVSEIEFFLASRSSFSPDFSGVPNALFVAHLLQHAAGRHGIRVSTHPFSSTS
jgi:hypothetical protein